VRQLQNLLALVVDIAVNCSFPYTYNGGLFHRCVENMIRLSPAQQPLALACINVHATPAVCYDPGEY